MENKDYLKVDLHHHTGVGFTTDGAADMHVRNNELYDGNVESLINEISEMDIIAVTNHNYFDKKQFFVLVGRVKNTLLLPGMEIDVINDEEKRFQCNLILPATEKSYDALECLNKKIKKNDKYFLTDKEFLEFITSLKEKAIILFDRKANKKTKAPFDFIKDFTHNELNAVAIEPSSSNIKTEQNINDISSITKELYLVKGSDRKSGIFSYILTENNFYSLFYSLSIGKDRVESEIDDIVERKHDKQIGKIKIEYKDQSVQEINFSSGINSIVGKSGTGKTMLLNEIYKYFTAKDIADTGIGKYQDDYKGKIEKIEIFNLNNKLLEKDASNIEIIRNLFKDIIIFSFMKEDSDELIYERLKITKPNEKKFDYFELSINNYYILLKDKRRINKDISKNIDIVIGKIISNVTNKPEKDSFFNLIINQINEDMIITNGLFKNISDSKKIKEIEELSGYINKKYDTSILNKEKINKIKLNIKVNIENELKMIKKTIFANRRKKIIVDRFSRKISDNSRLGKINQNNLLIIENSKKLIVSNLMEIKNTENKIVALDLENIIENLLVDNKHSESSDLCMAIIEGKIFKNILDILEIDGVTKTEISKFEIEDGDKITVDRVKRVIDEVLLLDKKKEISFKVIKDNIREIKIQLKIDNKFEEINKINPGSISKVTFEMFLEELKIKSFNIIVIDQPENDLDKEFIINQIIPALVEWRNQGKQIILCTHEPLIAINGDPDIIIETSTNDNKEYLLKQHKI